MIAARRFLAVVALPGAQAEQIAIGAHHCPDPVGEAQRGGQKDVRRGSALDQIGREFDAAGTRPPIEHPFRGSCTMVHIARVDVSARGKKEIDDLA